MKRIGNLYQKIYSIENLILADKNAQKGKKNQKGVIEHNKNRENNILSLHENLKNKTYKTSKYKNFKIFEPKEREISSLPYFPDRICHWAIMNILEPIFVRSFVTNTYNCIRGRGIHKASYTLRRNLKDIEGTKYCLKLDVEKFYPSISHSILKSLLRTKFKDNDLLYLLNEIIDSKREREYKWGFCSFGQSIKSIFC